MVNKVFKDLIGATMEVYIDDMLVKNIQRTNHLQYINKAFDLLRQYKVKINPEKCTFWVASGKFFGFLVIQRGIEWPTPTRSAILNMKSSTCVKEVQMMNRRRTSCSPQSVHQPIYGQMQAILSSLEEEWN